MERLSIGLLLTQAVWMNRSALPDRVDAAEFLDVDMDEFTGLVALIADDLRLWPQSGKPTEPAAAPHWPMVTLDGSASGQ